MLEQKNHLESYRIILIKEIVKQFKNFHITKSLRVQMTVSNLRLCHARTPWSSKRRAIMWALSGQSLIQGKLTF